MGRPFNNITSRPATGLVPSFGSVVAVLMFVYALLAPNPLTAHFGWRGVYTIAILGTVLLVALAIRGSVSLRWWFILTTLVTFILSSMAALYWGDSRYLFTLVFFVFALFLLHAANTRAIEKFITAASVFLLLMLIGSWIGSIIAIIGVPPLFEFANPDGRANYFYYTTFTNSIWGGIIRPAGIYDEPGTLSFIVCAVAALRHLRNRDSRFTWLLLGLGFITLSLAHLIYAILHFLAERMRPGNLMRIATVVIPIVVIAGSFGGFDIVNDRLFQRLALTETGTIAGDNRSWRMLNAVEHLQAQPASILFGADPSCRFDYDTCKQIFPMMGENPLSPLVFNGLLISWPYYLVLVLLLLAPLLGRRYLVAFAFGLLLLQRPSLLALGFSLLGLLVLWATYSHYKMGSSAKSVGSSSLKTISS